MAKFTSYALLGSGRVARHLQHYLQQLNLPVHLWSRNGDPRFNSFPQQEPTARLMRTVEGCSHILFAVSDPAIAGLSAQIEGPQTRIHFSGVASVDGVACAHPLMTFGENLETRGWYEQIPFVIEEGSCFEELLPGLPNRAATVAAADRPLYHALCALAGNSVFLLWKNIGDEFGRLGLPRELLAPFLHQVVHNATGSEPLRHFTGPVARGDWRAVRAHLDLLKPEFREDYRNYLNRSKAAGRPVPQELL